MSGHIPVFRAPDLPPGCATCLTCGALIRKEDWASGICPGTLTAPADQRRPT